MRGRLVGVFALTAAFLVLALYGIDLRAAMAALAGFDAWRIPIVTALYLVGLLARTERFRRLVPTSIAFGPTLAATGAGSFAINVLPLRMGEVVRPYLLSQRGIPLAESLAAVIIERLLDMLALLTMAFLVTSVLDAPVVVLAGVDVLDLGRRALFVSIALLLGLLLSLRLLAGTARMTSLLEKVRLGPLARRLGAALRGLAARTPMDIVVLLACTALSWGTSIAACGVVMGGFEAHGTSLRDVLFEWTATMAAMVLVPTPGFLGGFEAGAVGGLVALGSDSDVARAFALTLHAIQLAVTVGVGIAGFLVLGTRFGTAVAESRGSR